MEKIAADAGNIVEKNDQTRNLSLQKLKQLEDIDQKLQQHQELILLEQALESITLWVGNAKENSKDSREKSLRLYQGIENAAAQLANHLLTVEEKFCQMKKVR